MLFWLVILGVYMGWVESVYPKREPPDADAPPEIPESSFEERVKEKFDRDGKAALKENERLRRLPSPPEIFQKHIPLTEPPDDTPLLADAYLRAGGGG